MAESGDGGGAERQRVAPLEWFAAGLGSILTLAMLGIVVWHMLVEPEEQYPAVTVDAQDHQTAGSLHVVAIVARNHSPATAANVVIEGTLLDEGDIVEQAHTTLDYVPGSSMRRGGLFFTRDPRLHELRLRALGYADP